MRVGSQRKRVRGEFQKDSLALEVTQQIQYLGLSIHSVFVVQQVPSSVN